MRLNVDKLFVQRTTKRPSWWSVVLTVSLLLAASYGIGYLIGTLIKLC